MIYGYDIVADFENKRQLENLKEQLEKLKEENKEIKNFHINLVGVKECEIRELAKYKQAIEKIKEICKNVMPTGIDEETDKFGDILQICDEVNDEQ